MIANIALWSSVTVTCESDPSLSKTLAGRYLVEFGAVDRHAPPALGPTYDTTVRVTAMSFASPEMDTLYIGGHVLSVGPDRLVLTARAWSTPVLYEEGAPRGRIATEQTTYNDVRIVCAGPVTREVNAPG